MTTPRSCSRENTRHLVRRLPAWAATRPISATPQKRLGQAGELADGPGLINLRARYYDPSTGRFLTKDKWEICALISSSLHEGVF